MLELEEIKHPLPRETASEHRVTQPGFQECTLCLLRHGYLHKTRYCATLKIQFSPTPLPPTIALSADPPPPWIAEISAACPFGFRQALGINSSNFANSPSSLPQRSSSASFQHQNSQLNSTQAKNYVCKATIAKAWRTTLPTQPASPSFSIPPQQASGSNTSCRSGRRCNELHRHQVPYEAVRRIASSRIESSKGDEFDSDLEICREKQAEVVIYGILHRRRSFPFFPHAVLICSSTWVGLDLGSVHDARNRSTWLQLRWRRLEEKLHEMLMQSISCLSASLFFGFLDSEAF